MSHSFLPLRIYFYCLFPPWSHPNVYMLTSHPGFFFSLSDLKCKISNFKRPAVSLCCLQTVWRTENLEIFKSWIEHVEFQ
jgi:hypothetical protein